MTTISRLRSPSTFLQQSQTLPFTERGTGRKRDEKHAGFSPSLLYPILPLIFKQVFLSLFPSGFAYVLPTCLLHLSI